MRSEDELGFELFERTKRQVRLTKAGAEYLVGVRSGLADFEALARRARAARDGLRGTLTIGTAGTLMIEHLPRIVRAFRAEYPDVELTITILRNPDLARGAAARADRASRLQAVPLTIRMYAQNRCGRFATAAFCRSNIGLLRAPRYHSQN